MKIYCCNCEKDVNAKLVTGRVIYPYLKKLYSRPYWQCRKCLGYVGCHHKTKDRTRPIGVIPTQEMRNIRASIHDTLDDIWMGTDDPKYIRGLVYKLMSDKFGRQYHTASLRTLDDHVDALRYAEEIKEEYEPCVK